MGSELEAGPEMERAVAEACGFPVMLGFDTHCYDLGNQTRVVEQYRPSTDWNDAMLAAEKVGLFDDAQLFMSGPRRGGWWMIGRHQPREVIGDAPTGPLAICLAILRVNHA